MNDRFDLGRVPPSVAQIARALLAAGHEAWYVGGAVRDALLEARTGRAPWHPGDYDIATSARPETVQALFRRTVPVGIEHGTVAVLDDANRPHEVTTFRRDVRTDGRHAEVEFGVALDDDLARRDFTINAIAIHPVSGDLRDPFGGREDLANRVVRAVGDAAARFREDRLRILRGLRFAAMLDFAIEPATAVALRAAAHDLAHLSRERVRDEWVKMLRASVPWTGVELWRATGVLEEVWPELAPLDPARLPGPYAAPVEPVAATAACLHAAGAGSGAARAAAERLRFSRVDEDRLTALVRGLEQPLPDSGRLPGVRRWLTAHGAVADELLLLRPGPEAETVAAAVDGVRTRGEPLSVADLAVSGDDLAGAGIPRGPQMGRVLRALLDLVLDDPSHNQREALLAAAARLTPGAETG